MGSATATARGGMNMINGGRSSRGTGGLRRRPIPKRGQVKVGIVMGLANSVAVIFSRTRARAAPPPLPH